MLHLIMITVTNQLNVYIIQHLPLSISLKDITLPAVALPFVPQPKAVEYE